MFHIKILQNVRHNIYLLQSLLLGKAVLSSGKQHESRTVTNVSIAQIDGGSEAMQRLIQRRWLQQSNEEVGSILDRGEEEAFSCK